MLNILNEREERKRRRRKEIVHTILDIPFLPESHSHSVQKQAMNKTKTGANRKMSSRRISDINSMALQFGLILIRASKRHACAHVITVDEMRK